MKKRIGLLLILSVLLISLGLSITLLALRGRTYTSDGLVQNSRIYISDIYIENNTVHYTVINRSCQRIAIGTKPWVQKKIDGEWQSFQMWRYKTAIAQIMSPFSDTQKSFEIDVWIEDYVGEYRLGFGYKENIVGYFSITEEQARQMRDDRIYHADGLRGTEWVQLEQVRMEGEMLCFTAVNAYERQVSFSSTVLIQRKEGESWRFFHAEPIHDFSVASLSESDRRIAVTALPAGEYRCILRLDGFLFTEEDPETGEQIITYDPFATYAVGYFTVTT